MAGKQTSIKRKIAIDTLRSPELLAASSGCKLAWLDSVAHNASRYYSTFTRPKKNGKPRTITPPNKNLRDVQSNILKLLYQILPPFSHRICGGIQGRSIRQHAGFHVDKKLVITMDVENFFPSTTQEMVGMALKKAGLLESAQFIAAICCYQGALPQGSPTSMLLSNLSFLAIDSRMIAHCKRHNLNYSRYVDDIAVSGDYNFRSHLDAFSTYIVEHGYAVAKKKTLIMPQGTEQIVTGLSVNENMRPTKEYISLLRDNIDDCIELGAGVVADSLGFTITALKAKLAGRVNYVSQYDRARGVALGRKLYQLWNNEKSHAADKAGQLTDCLPQSTM